MVSNLTARQWRDTGFISVGARIRNRLYVSNNLPFGGYLGAFPWKIKQLDGKYNRLFSPTVGDKNEYLFCYIPSFTMDTERNVSYCLEPFSY